ncbi:hypothetical protein I3517_28265 [Rhodococcus erythropolis]|uniref:Uncharacterized protein n=1 Tax=Rhodococcus erythropolis TaxID=1833 RepID=A0A8I1D9U3_RHOER|nr:hypothetical protein [Rhodococcus erythropolis]
MLAALRRQVRDDFTYRGVSSGVSVEMSGASGRDVVSSRRAKMNHTIAPTTAAIQIVVVHSVRLDPRAIVEAMD